MKESDPADGDLETRLRAVEDRLAIYQLMVSHGPAIDSPALAFWSEAWTEDAIMDRGPPDPERHSGDRQGAYGKAGIIDEVASPEMERLRGKGVAHITTIPYLIIKGDEAIATNYTQLFGFENGSFRVRRIVATRWVLVRGSRGWQIKHRKLRLLDGDPEARAILRQGVEPEST